MHDCHFDYIKKLTKTHEYVLCGSVQDQMETQSKVSKRQMSCNNLNFNKLKKKDSLYNVLSLVCGRRDD